MEDYTLSSNLIEISQALLDVDSDDATAVMGWPDNLKLKSSMTLFALAKPECEVFQKVLDKFSMGNGIRNNRNFAGQKPRTMW